MNESILITIWIGGAFLTTMYLWITWLVNKMLCGEEDIGDILNNEFFVAVLVMPLLLLLIWPLIASFVISGKFAMLIKNKLEKKENQKEETD